jgi:hypothetical protein
MADDLSVIEFMHTFGFMCSFFLKYNKQFSIFAMQRNKNTD